MNGRRGMHIEFGWKARRKEPLGGSIILKLILDI
jgi:hypothetical protein